MAEPEEDAGPSYGFGANLALFVVFGLLTLGSAAMVVLASVVQMLVVAIVTGIVTFHAAERMIDTRPHLRRHRRLA